MFDFLLKIANSFIYVNKRPGMDKGQSLELQRQFFGTSLQYPGEIIRLGMKFEYKR